MSTFSRMVDQWILENLEVQQSTPAVVELSPDDPSDWAEDFHRWVLSRCIYRARCFGETGALYIDFCEWAVLVDSLPCMRATFEALLREAGLLFADGMVSGLILKANLKRPFPDVSSGVRKKRNMRNKDGEFQPSKNGGRS